MAHASDVANVEDLVLQIREDDEDSEADRSQRPSDMEARAGEADRQQARGRQPAGQPAVDKLTRAHCTNFVAYMFTVGVTCFALSSAYGESHRDLSAKYQTLMTPDRWTFLIWFPIFFLELIFVTAQMTPRFRNKPIVAATTRWWLATCAFQISWALTFSEEQLAWSVMSMIGILVSLTGMSIAVDGMGPLSLADYGVLRAPFMLHLGWVVCDFAVNVNMLADSMRAGPGVLFGIAMLSLGGILMVSTAMTLALQRPEPLIGAAAAWGYAGIAAELVDPARLNEPGRFNPHLWNLTTLEAVRIAALGFALAATLLALAGLAARTSRFGGKVGRRTSE